jgi:hypothetical protein
VINRVEGVRSLPQLSGNPHSVCRSEQRHCLAQPLDPVDYLHKVGVTGKQLGRVISPGVSHLEHVENQECVNALLDQPAVAFSYLAEAQAEIRRIGKGIMFQNLSRRTGVLSLEGPVV